MKQSKLATALLLALSIFGMTLAGAPNAFSAEDDDDDDEVIEEVVVTAYRMPIYVPSAAMFGMSTSYAYVDGRWKSEHELALEWLVESVRVPPDVKAAGTAATATYVCGRMQMPQSVRAGCVAAVILVAAQIREC